MFRNFFAYATVLGALAGFARGDDTATGGVARDLGHYFPIRAALAKDDVAGVKEHARLLATSSDRTIATAGSDLAAAADLESARRAFGDLSKAVLASVERALANGERTGAVHVFRCPMAKPNGTWLQETKEIGNPYYGSSMLRCGKLIETKGALRR